ncbi:hypothetical protein [Nitratireductor pacificus]|uniref:hypothetical protein n=1 Tax=Nitratireductor pacificus TaxID=1231180 RepID=UPI0012F62901|nr:hypothetical protein [Nitratireductor pacificus]
MPLFFIYNILPAALRQAGHPPEIANLVFLAYLPFALRVAWAPAVARLGRGDMRVFRRVALCSLVGAILLTAALNAFDPASAPLVITALATLVIGCVSTAAVALDGYLLSGFTPEERRRSAPFQGVGLALGGLVLGLTVMIGGDLGWRAIVVLLIAMTSLLTLPALLLPSGGTEHGRFERAETRLSGLWSFLTSAPARRILLLSLLVRAGLGLAGGMLPVLQVDAGLSLGQIGMLAAIGSNGTGIAASVFVGLALARLGAWQVASASAVLAAVAMGAFAFSDIAGSAGGIVLISLVTMGLSYMFFVIFRALVLPICSGRGSTVQASAFASIDALIATFFAIGAGGLLSAGGASLVLAITAVLCAASGAFAWRVHSRTGEPTDHEKSGVMQP